MKNVLLASLLLLLLFFQCTAVQATPDFLSPKEIAWLGQHQRITVGPDPNFAPFEFLDSDNNYKGMSREYLNYISKVLGISFETIKARNWLEILTMAKQRQVDILPAIVPSPSRRKFLNFSKAWISVPGVVISAQQCHNVEDLGGKTVAVVAGSIWDDYLSNHSVDVKLIRVEDTRTAIELTSMSNVYATVTDLASATDNIHKLGISNLRIVLRIDKKVALSFGVRKDWPQLVSILNKTLENMNPILKQEIRHRWINLGEIPWWRNTSLIRTGLFIILGFLAVILFFFFWNRILRRQVKKRSLALEQAHRSLIRAAKMESVGQLAAGVAHEVKNPLAIISMGVEFLSGSKNRDATEQEILLDMDDALQRANKVIGGLLDYSRYSTLERSPGDLNRVIRKALHLVDHEIKRREIEVYTDLGALKTAYFEVGRLQQVFINLFINSVQAMEDGGTLEIVSTMHRLRKDEIELSHGFVANMEVIKVTVSDSGSGIQPIDSDKIFDPFYTTKDVGEGTGLGLSESRNIIELHNGSLHLMDNIKKGACAILILPCEKGEEHDKEKDPAH